MKSVRIKLKEQIVNQVEGSNTSIFNKISGFTLVLQEKGRQTRPQLGCPFSAVFILVKSHPCFELGRLRPGPRAPSLQKSNVPASKIK